jgi:ABC-type transport system involved in cytochrome bd biosynthesis fused ATPase/permease subunit
MTETIELLLKQIEKRKLLPPLLAGLMAGLMGLGLMGAGAWLIAWAARQPPLYTLALGVTCVRACGIFRAVFRYLERYFAHSLAFSAYSRLQQHVYQRAAKALPLKSGSLAQGVWLERLLQDCGLWRDTYVRTLLPLSVAFCLTLCFCAALCSYSPLASASLALVFLLLILLPLTFPSQKLPSQAAYRQEIIEMLAGREDLLDEIFSRFCLGK